MLGCLKRARWGFVVGLLSLASTASAVTEPGGMAVPVIDGNVTSCTDKNVEVCIDQAEGDASLIDAKADAIVVPETFQPTCQLTFTPLVKGGLIAGLFGWYNVKEDPNNAGSFLKPGAADYFGMFASEGFQTGADFAGESVVLDLEAERVAGRYKGGQIGFFLASGGALEVDPETHQIVGNPSYLFHTQHALNVGGTAAMPFYNVLTWESIAHENTFYFGWEDLPPNSPIDYDFDDWLFSVTGVQCGGGGQACDTGLMGTCAAGVLQCKKGVIQCVQSIPESPESCNALDDDCNGEVDEGENLCDARSVCYRGRCVPKCGTAEFRCPGGSACATSGLCVDKACEDVPCDAGQVCVAGECQDSCTGVVCPHGRLCRNGGCVDPCVGIECDAGFSCVLGVCSSCECSSCGDGKVCHDSLCVDTGCETKTCDADMHCSLGECVDDCDGAVCPDGQRCVKGECEADASVIPGGGSGGTGFVLGPVGGNSSASGGNKPGSGSGAQTGNELDVSEPACGCQVPGAAAGGKSALLLLALAGLLRRRRKN